jgi:amidase
LRGQRVALYVNESGGVVITHETRRAILDALRALKSAGLDINEEEPPGIERASALWPAMFSHASMVQLREVYAGQEEKAGAVVRGLLASAENSLPPADEESGRVRAERDALRSALVKWMNSTPLILAPVGATHAFPHGVRRVTVGAETMSVFRAFNYSRTFNVLDLPCAVVPAGRTPEGLPVGVQIIGRPFEEETVLAAASIIEEELGGWVQPPVAAMA